VEGMTVRIDLIGFVVADMARSLEFYRSLGLEIPAGAESEDHVEITLPGGIRLGWDTIEVVKSFDEAWTAPVGGHRMVPAFLCDSPAELDRLYAELVAAGAEAHKEPWDAFWGQRYAIVKDPDGNSVELFAPLPA
jgi:catechol 2,3-dioxygenase-like lactoylglutathione lyase family enzyme